MVSFSVQPCKEEEENEKEEEEEKQEREEIEEMNGEQEDDQPTAKLFVTDAGLIQNRTCRICHGPETDMVLRALLSQRMTLEMLERVHKLVFINWTHKIVLSSV